MSDSARVADAGGPYVADIDPAAVVIRFRPTDPTAVLRSAEKEFRRTGVYGVSVFADLARSGESDADTIRRLVAVAGLSGLDLSSNKRVYVCSRAAEILALKLRFTKDDDPDELAEHYSVDLGQAPTVDVVESFLGVFDEGRSST